MTIIHIHVHFLDYLVYCNGSLATCIRSDLASVLATVRRQWPQAEVKLF